MVLYPVSVAGTFGVAITELETRLKASKEEIVIAVNVFFILESIIKKIEWII